MNIFEVIAERRIEAAIEEGVFDNLAGAGQPIGDLDQVRPPGWWAARLVREERDRDVAVTKDVIASSTMLNRHIR